MSAKTLRKVVTAVATLSPGERGEVRNCIDRIAEQANVAGLLAERLPDCPSCGAGNPHRWGKSGAGTPRFRCRGCGRTVNALTGSPLEGLHKRELWVSYAEGMTRGETLQAAADRVGIALATSHQWRHRFLRAQRTSAKPVARGIAEEDETFVARSEKGAYAWRLRRLLPSLPPPARKARKRGRHGLRPGLSHDQVAIVCVRERGSRLARTGVADGTTAAAIAPVLLTSVAPDCLLMTDAGRPTGAAARLAGLSHIAIVGGRGGIDPAHHIQTVNSYHASLKIWLAHFRGVATSWLGNYAQWFATLSEAETPVTGSAFLRLAMG